MIFLFGLLLLFVHKTTPLQEQVNLITKNTTSTHPFQDNILCRVCGNNITFSSGIISKVTPFSRYSYHDSIFSKDEVLIQVLMNDFSFAYPMITTTQSNCIGISEWEEADSWYPGHRWKPCVCPECGTLVGWVFEPMNPSIIDQAERFFGLIITSLIGESCKYYFLGDKVWGSGIVLGLIWFQWFCVPLLFYSCCLAFLVLI